MWKNTRLFLGALVLTAIGFIGSTSAQTGTTVRWSWNAPLTGSPVEHYDLSVASDSTLVPTAVAISSLTSISYLMPVGIRYVRVRGVDALNRSGPWSVAAIWNDAGAPGGCTGLKWTRI